MIAETIRKKGSKWCLFSKKSNKNLGCYDTKAGAKKREKQVQFFKHQALDRTIDALIEGFLSPGEAVFEVDLPEQTDDLPDPEEKGQQYLKSTPIWAMQMDRDFDVVTLEGPVKGDSGDWLAKNPETGELWPINDEVFGKTYKPVSAEKQNDAAAVESWEGILVGEAYEALTVRELIQRVKSARGPIYASCVAHNDVVHVQIVKADLLYNLRQRNLDDIAPFAMEQGAGGEWYIDSPVFCPPNLD